MYPSIIRIKHDMKEIYKDPWYDYMVKIGQTNDRPFVVTASLVGRLTSSDELDAYLVTMNFSENYPFSPPTVIVHGEVNPEFAGLMENLLGALLRANWTATKSIKDILNFLCTLLHWNPIGEEALAQAMAHLSIP